MQALIKASALSHIYSKNTPFERRALDGVDLEIFPGEFLGIIGQTGSGKSTLISHLNGLLRPSEGQLLFEGEDIWKEPARARALRFRVGLCFQFPEYQLFEETVFKDVAFGPRNMGLGEDEIARRVRDAVSFVGLPEDVLTRSPFELSGGQKRRVAIAGVIAMEPQVLILDEPTAGLDPASRESILQNIRDYHAQKGAAVVIVSHSMEEIARTASRLYVVDAGKIVLSGSPHEVFAHAAKLEELGLGVPQMTRVMHRLVALGAPLDPAVYSLEQAKQSILAAYRAKTGGA